LRASAAQVAPVVPGAWIVTAQVGFSAFVVALLGAAWGVVRLEGRRSRACRCSRGRHPSGFGSEARDRLGAPPRRHPSGVGDPLTRTRLRRAFLPQRPSSSFVVFTGTDARRTQRTTTWRSARSAFWSDCKRLLFTGGPVVGTACLGPMPVGWRRVSRGGLLEGDQAAGELEQGEVVLVLLRPADEDGRLRFSQECVASRTQRRARQPGVRALSSISSPRARMCGV